MSGPDPDTFTASGARAARSDHGTSSARSASYALGLALAYRRAGYLDAAAYWTAYAEQMADLEVAW
jgi:hypothetical protein